MDISVNDFNKLDFESYKAQILVSLKQNKMAVMSDEALLKWIDEIIKIAPEVKKE